MLPPAFSIVRAIQKTIHEFGPSLVKVLLGGSDEGFNFLWSRRESYQTVSSPANQFSGDSHRGRLEPGCLQLGADKSVNWIASPFFPRHLWLFYRHKSPHVFRLITTISPFINQTARCLKKHPFVINLHLALSHPNSFLDLIIRPRRSGINPSFEIGDLLLREAVVLFWRHFVVRILPANRFHNKAVIRVAGDKYIIKRIAAKEKLLASSHEKIPLDLLSQISMAP